MYIVQCHDCNVFTNAEKLWVRRSDDRVVGVWETCGRKTGAEPAGDRLYVLEAEDADGGQAAHPAQPDEKPKRVSSNDNPSRDDPTPTRGSPSCSATGPAVPP